MVTISWSRSRGDSSRSPARAITTHDQPDDAADAVLVRPDPRVMNDGGDGGAADDRDDQAPDDRAAGPEPHGRGPAHLGEKSRISAGVATRQMPSTRPTTKVATAKNHLLVAAGMTKATNTPVTSRPPTTRLARPSRSVMPGQQRAERPDQVPEGQGHHEEREAHVQVGQDQRGHRGADVQLVVQRDGGQHGNGQIKDAGPGVGICLELPAPQPRCAPVPVDARLFCGHTHPDLAIVVAGQRPVDVASRSRYPHYPCEFNGAADHDLASLRVRQIRPRRAAR